MTDSPRRAPGRASRTSRREFLATTAGAAAGSTLLGACQTWDASRPIPKAALRPRAGADDALRIGVIGTGGMGTAHALRLTELAADGKDKVQVAAVADVCGPRMEAAQAECAKRQSIEVGGFRDYRELLRMEDLHGVLIASPEHWHAEMAEHAIAAGLDVYVEKPMTLRLPEALRLRQVAAANPEVIVQVGTQFLMHEKYHVARQWIAEGRIGKPTFSQTGYCRNSRDGEWLYEIKDEWVPGDNLDWDAWCGPLGPKEWDPAVYARWRRYRTYSTGIVGDLLVHVMTPMVFALDQGWPVRVVACGGHYQDTAMENHDQVNVTVQFEKGHTMTVCGSTCNEQGVPTMIRGHEATLYLGSKDCVIRPERPFAEEIDEETQDCAPQSGDQDRLRLDWLAAMRARQPNLSGVELGAQVMVIVDLATRSMWEGKAFAFDPQSMTANPA